ncbi:hypothetical protein, partial [Novosphingobium sp.]
MALDKEPVFHLLALSKKVIGSREGYVESRDIMPLMPSDWAQGTFVGRADFGEGPSPILVLRGE